jgi:TRAP-type mannitol/chloroaromatic compound transport system permease small subunit
MAMLFRKNIENLSSSIGALCAWLALAMTLLGASNAVLRYLGRFVGRNLTSNALLEAQWYLFSAVFLLAGASALREDRHVRVDVLQSRLQPRTKYWIDLLGACFFLLPFCAYGIWSSAGFFGQSWRVLELSPDAGGLPRYPVKALIPAAFSLLLLQALAEISRLCGKLFGKVEEAGQAGSG